VAGGDEFKIFNVISKINNTDENSWCANLRCHSYVHGCAHSAQILALADKI